MSDPAGPRMDQLYRVSLAGVVTDFFLVVNPNQPKPSHNPQEKPAPAENFPCNLAITVQQLIYIH